MGLLLSLSIFSLPSLANHSHPLRQGLPGRRISGGVRLDSAGSCLSNVHQSLVAIIPRDNLGKTADEHPTFWFSIPETTKAKTGEFQLFNESEEMIYATQIDLGDNHGLSDFQLPQSAPVLAINTNYRWVFSVACIGETSSAGNHTSASPILSVQGWVRRVESSNNVTSQITTTNPTDRISIYATAGLWHEQITELINLRRQNMTDTDIQEEWSSLVEANGLTDYISHNISNTTMMAAETTITTELSANLVILTP